MSITKLPLAFLLLFLPVLSLAAEPKVYYWSVREDCFHLVDYTISPDERLPKEEFNEQEKTIVLIHGFAENIHRKMYRDFARRIKKFEPKTNVLGIDWSEEQDFNVRLFSFSEPLTTATRIPDVSRLAYKKLCSHRAGLNLCPQNMHIIGFSHGAHIAALIGHNACASVAHITFLDPSPAKSHIFSWDNFLGKGLDAKSCAHFTDMYKTSSWASTSAASGHVSFYVYPNGIKPPEPLFPFPNDDLYKNHYYSFHWYITTIGKKENKFGYSIKVPDKSPSIDPTFKTINSSLPRKSSAEYTPQDYKNVKSVLNP